MIGNNFVVFFIYLCLFCSALSVLAKRKNICPDATGCKCVEFPLNSTRGNLLVTCSGDNPKVELVPLTDVETFTFQEFNYSNPRQLTVLRKAKYLKRVSFFKPGFSDFYWEWFPAFCKTVHVTYPRVEIRFVGQSENATCTFPENLNVSFLHMSAKDGTSTTPSCYPQSITILSFRVFPFFNFAAMATPGSNTSSTTHITWPKYLRALQIKEAAFPVIGDHVFRHAPLTLRTLLIANCKVPIRGLPLIWPENLELLQLTKCDINHTKVMTFDLLKHVKHLMIQRNHLVSVPGNLPPSLEVMILSNNDIRLISDTAWSGVPNLRKLWVSRNKLESIPLNLPSGMIELTLSYNQIEYFNSRAFKHLTKLRQLDLSRNRLLNMPVNLPSTMTSLNIGFNRIAFVHSSENYEFCVNCSLFHVTGNPWVCDENFITMLIWIERHPVIVRSVYKLKGRCAAIQQGFSLQDVFLVKEYHKDLTRISNNTCQFNVTNLYCVNNGLYEFPPNPPLKVIRIEIRQNQNLTKVPDGIYVTQTEMTELNLNQNSLTSFPHDLPPSLERLSLRNNRIRAITSEDQPTINRLTRLKQLYLDDNDITIVYDYQLTPMTSIRWIGLHGNPLRCDCSMQSLMKYLDEKIGLDRSLLGVVHTTPRCASPPISAGRSIIHLTGIFTYHFRCLPARCNWENTSLNCSRATQVAINTRIPSTPGELPYLPHNTYWQSLDLSGLDLTESVVDLRNLSRLSELNLHDNRMTSLPPKLPLSLRHLDVSRNNITSLFTSSNTSENLKGLKTLDLSWNKMSTFSKEEISFFVGLDRVELAGNPLHCDCDSSSFVIWMKSNENLTKFLNLKNLTCTGSDGSVYDVIKITEDQYCPPVDSWKMKVASICAVVALLLFVVILSIYLHKRRKNKGRDVIVDGFQNLLWRETQAAEELYAANKGYPPVAFLYDAFVSFDSADEEFVFQLVEELESRRGRKVCFHMRDFIAGRRIADNIVQMMSQSRHVVMILSSKFLSSDWCKYEATVAMQRLHVTMDRKLVVPIMIEDFPKTDELSRNLQTLISVNPPIYLPHGGAAEWKKFWGKLDSAVGGGKLQPQDK